MTTFDEADRKMVNYYLSKFVKATVDELEWKPFPRMTTAFYAEVLIGSDISQMYTIRTLPTDHSIENYRGRLTASGPGGTLYEYRPAKTPVFFESMEDAQKACERDYRSLVARWNTMLEKTYKDPDKYVPFSQIS